MWQEATCMTRTPTPPAPVSLAEFDRMYESVKNWGKWGSDDDRGTLNYITPDKVAAGKAARCRLPSMRSCSAFNSLAACAACTSASSAIAG